MILPRGLKGPNFEQRAKKFLSFIVKDFYEDLGASQMKVFRARRIEYLKKFELENNKANPKFKEKYALAKSYRYLDDINAPWNINDIDNSDSDYFRAKP